MLNVNSVYQKLDAEALAVSVGVIVWSEGNGFRNADLHEHGFAVAGGEFLEFIIEGGNVATDDEGKDSPTYDGWKLIYRFMDHSRILVRKANKKEVADYTQLPAGVESETQVSDQALVTKNLRRFLAQEIIEADDDNV
jgi:hypothetical protein